MLCNMLVVCAGNSTNYQPIGQDPLEVELSHSSLHVNPPSTPSSKQSTRLTVVSSKAAMSAARAAVWKSLSEKAEDKSSKKVQSESLTALKLSSHRGTAVFTCLSLDARLSAVD